MHFLLFYEAGEDYVARRAAFRAVHLELAWAASERGELVLGGALADPVDGALLLFRSEAGEDYVARRAAFRAAHLELAWAASERGELVLGGALADPVDGALLLFEANSPSV